MPVRHTPCWICFGLTAEYKLLSSLMDKKSNIPIRIMCVYLYTQHNICLECAWSSIESDPSLKLNWFDVHHWLCLKPNGFDVHHWFSLKMYPVWQVSQVSTKSNGSSYNALLLAHPGDWWMDMDIQLQESCEIALSSSKRCIQICFLDMNYIYDLESMTQLNLKSGTLRQIRRRVLFELP